jgi:hypothetical protein
MFGGGEATGDYLKTPKGRLGRYRWRTYRRVCLVEPRGKKSTSENDLLEFQGHVLKQLKKLRRQAFRGPIVLQVSLTTSGKTPSHAHTIAKNLLDLLSRPARALDTTRRGLLYLDDGQIHGLSVSCRHGGAKPEIFMTAMPLAFFLDDLDLAMHAAEELNSEDDMELHHGDNAIDSLRDFLTDKNGLRQVISRKADDSFLGYLRQQAQLQLLGRSTVSLSHLGDLFRIREGRRYRDDPIWNALYGSVEKIFRQAPFRILLAELPKAEGSSKLYKRDVEANIRRFQNDFSWIMVPLRVPVALEVVVKPPPDSKGGANDVDNILRNYIIPKVIEVLQPPSHIAWTIDIEAMKKDHPESERFWQRDLERLPRSTRIGITRYEVWRLSRFAGDKSPGFVSVALMADMFGTDDILHRIDTIIEKWEKHIRY